MSNESALDRDAASSLGVNLIALLWGFSEATFSIFIPDVWLTWVALDKRKRPWTASGYAVFGALIGGSLMFVWGSLKTEDARTFLCELPDISIERWNNVGDQLDRFGPAAVFLGPIRGIPYKIYATRAGELQKNVLVFILLSIPARHMRFLLMIGLTLGIRKAAHRWSLGRMRCAHLAVWILFYGFYLWRFASGS